MAGKLLPSHHLKAVAALDQAADEGGDEPNLLETVNLPLVGQGELEKHNLANLMNSPIMLD